MKSLLKLNTATAKAFFLIGIVNLYCQIGLGQQAPTSLANYFGAIRNGEQSSLPYQLLRQQGLLDDYIRVIDTNLSDSLSTVRKACYQSLDVMQKSSTAPAAKQQILALQLQGMADESPDIVGLSTQNLSSVPPSMFNASQKKTLIQTLDRQVAKKEVLIKMVGTLKDQSAAPALRQLSQPGNSAKVRWAAYLALSRLGDQTAINLVNNKVRGIEVNDDMVYDMAPSIIYTQQKQLYDYLVELLYSNEKNCESANPDQTNTINCAYRILELLAPQIVDFPIATTASGDLQTKSYQEALITAREWFSVHVDFQVKNTD
ncbi:HEAT repeat domain-containing protein [Imperialibacter roseus]|uniref:HEAT repeat domain-containing protein n=1 Tax=Imperialibacter roseus TaxID=1324217 RepID=A0ABZ0IS34_9BACT|nr:HEAT repeat domain-containing protein [Imperialibacter roseus]WOK06397.1 HEAT repeat domain-containing protein [Imperialibacter roseus]